MVVTLYIACENASYHVTVASIIAVSGGVYGATNVGCHEQTGSGSSQQSGGFQASGSFLPSGRTKPKCNNNMLYRSQIGSINCDSGDVYNNDQKVKYYKTVL